VIAIVQARMGASRLPGKMMLPLHGYPVVEWVFRRVSRCGRIDGVVFAIPETGDSDVLDAFLRRLGATVVRGSETDVVARFDHAASVSRASHVVRVCADNPLICWREVDRLVDFFFAHACDYAYNHVPRGNRYPDGLGAEIVSTATLSSIHRNATLPGHREHVFDYIWSRPDSYVIRTFDPPEPELAHPELKLDLDTAEDYRRLLGTRVDIDMDGRQIVAAFLENQT
jgi:spore coat polysaccharide biosynthesis protein SpsF